MTSTHSRLASLVATLLASTCAAMLVACSKQAPAPEPSSPTASPAPSAEAASSPLPGVVGQPSDVSAAHTPTAPSNGATAVGGLSTHPESGTSGTGGTSPPTGGDASPGHAASAASP